MAADEIALVTELAQLARVELAPEDAQTFGAQLETILGYIRGLQAVEVEGIPEYEGAGQLRSSLRDDLVSAGHEVDRILSAANPNPERLVEVPKFKD